MSSFALRLADEIPASDPDVGRAIGDELGDVLCAHEDGLELAAERRDECALAARADFESRIAEELAHVLGEPALVRQRDFQHSSPSDTSMSFSFSNRNDTKKARPSMDGPKTPGKPTG